jgi:hypothetical protein
VRGGVYSINLTNHGNLHDVYNNEACHSLEASLAFSAAWMASFSVLEIEYMAHNDLREHRVRGGLRRYGRAR